MGKICHSKKDCNINIHHKFRSDRKTYFPHKTKNNAPCCKLPQKLVKNRAHVGADKHPSYIKKQRILRS